MESIWTRTTLPVHPPLEGRHRCDAVVLGGGIMREPYILGQLERMTAPMVKPSFRGCRVAPAALGNNAGLMGAGYLAANIGSGWHPPRSGRTI